MLIRLVSVVMTKLKTTVLAFSAMIFVANVSAAEAIYPLVTYKCDSAADIITITNSLLKSDEGASFEYSDADGTYSPWELVEIDRRTERTRIVKTKKVIKNYMYG